MSIDLNLVGVRQTLRTVALKKEMVVSVPSYSDIGKAAKDLLGKDYPVGSVKMEFNTTSASGVKVTVTGDKDNKTGAVVANLKYKFSDKERGLVFTQTIKTSNAVSGQLEVTDTIVKGLKLDIETNLNDTGIKTVTAGAELKKKCVIAKSTLDIYNGPLISAEFSTGKSGFLVGGDASYDVRGAKLSKWGYAAGYVDSDYALTARGVSNCAGLELSYYQKVNSDTEVAIKSSSTFKQCFANSTIEAGAKYTLDANAFVKVKANSSGVLGLGYMQALRPGIKLSIGGLFDTGRLQENVHKIGISMNIEA